MSDHPADDVVPLDRWAVPLGETAAPPPVPALTPPDAPEPEVLRFPLEPDVPSDEFQPRLLRFGKAG